MARNSDRSSSNSSVEASPVVPQTTSPSLPFSSSAVASAVACSRSTEPSSRMGVTMAVKTRPNSAKSVIAALLPGPRRAPPGGGLEAAVVQHPLHHLHHVQGGALAQNCR